MKRAFLRSLALAGALLLLAPLLYSQNECSGLGFPLRSERDNSGILHQTLCVNPADGSEVRPYINIFPGSTSFANLNNIYSPNTQAGATCGDKINNLITNTPNLTGGAVGGIIQVNRACGTGSAGSPWAAVTLPAFVSLQFIEPGIYWTNSITYSSTAGQFGASIIGLPCSKTSGGSPQQCPVELHQGNGLNNHVYINMNMANGALRDIVVDGNVANNATGGPCVTANAGSLDFSNVVIQNCPTHGLEFAGVGITNNTNGSRMNHLWILNNKADGVYALNTGDLLWGNESISLQNGTTATVNTTNTTITATAGSWSTDSSLIGTMVRVNNSIMCQIQAVPSTTTFTVTSTKCWNLSGVPTALGTLTGVQMVFGNSWEASDSPTTRFGHGELSTSKMDAFLSYGTTIGFGSNREIFGQGIQMGNDGNYDIEIIGSCLDNQAVNCAIGNTITGLNFIGSQLRTSSAGTYSFVKLLDGGSNLISGNTFTYSTGGNQEKTAVEQVESSDGRAQVQNVSGPNSFSGAAFTANYIDNTSQGTMGMIIPQHCGANSSIAIFNAAPGTTNPTKFLCVANDGSLRVVNNAFNTTIFQLNDNGALFLNGNPVPTYFSANSASLGGSLLAAGACSTNTTTVTGATTSMIAIADPQTYPGDGTYWDATVTSANTVTTKVCAVVSLTPTASVYSIRVFP